MNFIACAVIVFQCAIAAGGSNNALRPFGMMMCERFCQQTGGCIKFGFSYRQLSCHVLPVYRSLETKDDTIGLYNVTKVTHLSEEACPLTSRKFYSKLKFEICRSNSNSLFPKTTLCLTRDTIYHEYSWHDSKTFWLNDFSRTQLEKDLIQHTCSPERQPRKDMMKKLLIARSRPGEMKQVSLIKNVLTTYLDTFQGVSAIAYVPASKQIVYYILDAMSLIMSSTNGSNAVKIKGDCHYLIAVAEDRIFFISSPNTANELMHATPYGQDIKSVRTLKGRPQSMAVDLKRRFLYVEVMYVTYVYNYKGEKQSQLEASNVSIEPYSDYLFLSDEGRTRYFRMLLDGTNNNRTLFASLEPKDGMICVHQSTLYILSPETCDVKVVSTSQSNLIKLFKPEKYLSCYCCLLP